jgi:CheY-like chemotaxis protein
VQAAQDFSVLAHFFHQWFIGIYSTASLGHPMNKQEPMAAVGRTILIVEDNLDFHMLTKLALNKNGYRVESLFDGKLKDVLKKLVKCDVVLLDIDLPSESGTDISNGIKNNPSTNHIPVIMITGNAEGPSLCTKAHADACLIKPFPFVSLLQTIEGFFKKASA